MQKTYQRMQKVPTTKCPGTVLAESHCQHPQQVKGQLHQGFCSPSKEANHMSHFLFEGKTYYYPPNSIGTTHLGFPIFQREAKRDYANKDIKINMIKLDPQDPLGNLPCIPLDSLVLVLVNLLINIKMVLWWKTSVRILEHLIPLNIASFALQSSLAFQQNTSTATAICKQASVLVETITTNSDIPINAMYIKRCTKILLWHQQLGHPCDIQSCSGTMALILPGSIQPTMERQVVCIDWSRGWSIQQPSSEESVHQIRIYYPPHRCQRLQPKQTCKTRRPIHCQHDDNITTHWFHQPGCQVLAFCLLSLPPTTQCYSYSALLDTLQDTFHKIR